MTKKKDPPNVFDPPGFKEAVEIRDNAEAAFESTEWLGRWDLGGSNVYYSYGPLPQPLGDPSKLFFQVLWFGGPNEPWPHYQQPVPAPIATEVKAADDGVESKVAGKMALWFFDIPSNAASVLRVLWDIELAEGEEIPEGIVN